jgi:hypothetical protein
MVNPHSKFNKSEVMAIPCGLSARSTFNDNFTLFRCEKSFNCVKTADNIVNIKRDSIAWSDNETNSYSNINVSDALSKGLISEAYLK